MPQIESTHFLWFCCNFVYLMSRRLFNKRKFDYLDLHHLTSDEAPNS